MLAVMLIILYTAYIAAVAINEPVIMQHKILSSSPDKEPLHATQSYSHVRTHNIAALRILFVALHMYIDYRVRSIFSPTRYKYLQAFEIVLDNKDKNAEIHFLHTLTCVLCIYSKIGIRKQ